MEHYPAGMRLKNESNEKSHISNNITHTTLFQIGDTTSVFFLLFSKSYAYWGSYLPAMIWKKEQRDNFKKF